MQDAILKHQKLINESYIKGQLHKLNFEENLNIKITDTTSNQTNFLALNDTHSLTLIIEYLLNRKHYLAGRNNEN